MAIEDVDQNPRDRLSDERSDSSDFLAGGSSDSSVSEEGGKKRRETFYLAPELSHKLRAYAYWERIGISEIVNVALEQFFKDKEVKPLPPKRTLS